VNRHNYSVSSNDNFSDSVTSTEESILSVEKKSFRKRKSHLEDEKREITISAYG
jgi:hypothetical protein